MSNLPRFFLTRNEIKKDKFVMVDKELAHKLRHVLRLKKGSKVCIIDKEGNEIICVIDTISAEKIMGSFVEKKESVESGKPLIALAQALPKAGKIDEIVKDNTQIGVDAFIFFESEYSVVKKYQIKAEKIERLERLAIESSRQCERNTIPSIEEIMSFDEVIKLNFDKKILLHSRQNKGSVNLLEIKQSLKPIDKVLMMVGPEGGFSPKEIELARNQSFQIAYMKLPILRTELAGVIAISNLIS